MHLIMRILEINKFNYARRGAERHFLDLVHLLKRRGHEVAVFAMHHPENQSSEFSRFFPSFVGYHSSEAALWQRIVGTLRIFWSFEAHRKMKKLLENWKPDIAHIHNIYHQISPSILSPLKERGIPIVMTVHDYHLISPDKDQYYHEVGESYWKFLLKKKYSFTKRFLLVLKMYWESAWKPYEKYVDLFVVPSSYVRDVMLSAGIEKSKIVVLPHFFTRETEYHDSPSDQEQSYALYFGALSEEKSINNLADIFHELKIPLVLAGSCEQGFQLRKSDYVAHVGTKSKSELERLIRQASCVVSASVLPETFGLIALEAIANGKPFFGLKSGAMPEVIEDGRDGKLCDDLYVLKESLREFFSGNSLFSADDMIQRAENRFGSDRYGKAIEKLFAQVIP